MAAAEKEQGGVMASAADEGGEPGSPSSPSGPDSADGADGAHRSDSDRKATGAGATGGDAPGPPVRVSVWQGGGRPDRHRRSGQSAALDRTKIVETAVRLLDAEGAAKFSMRRLAAELDVTAMSVYWYVDNKEDLLEYALDAVYGDLELPDVSDPALWREQLRRLTLEFRTLLVRHPWTPALVGHFLNIGPNAVSFGLTAQKVMGHAGLPSGVRLGGLAAVFQFVYGFGTIEGQFIARCAAAGVTEDEYLARAMTLVDAVPGLGEYAEAANELLDARGVTAVPEMRQHDFDFALDLLIAGIERMVERGGG
ncbi:TetR/AcrR family transcriptional regulator [Streptomyces sp. NPDC058953]|uniref:TetR/AcrR family transcriptional regulator n=1 Tax=unclassified Streptomyces TaxID=2593676 RepID=UPI0036B30AB4